MTKTAFTNVSDCRRELTVEIPPATVAAAIDRLAQRYGRAAKVPGFRPGKVPSRIVRARYRDQILQDVAQDLISKAVDDALTSEGVTPIATPQIQDVEIDEGKPLTFRATFETLPEVDPGGYDAFTLRQTPVEIDTDAVDKAMVQLQQRASRLEPVTGRGIEPGDTVTLDLERRILRQPAAAEPPAAPEHQENAAVEIGHEGNPPGFDDAVLGLEVGARQTFTLTYPDQQDMAELAGAEAEYTIEVKGLHRREVPALDDEFARRVGEFDDLDTLRTRVTEDLRRRGDEEARLDLRRDLLRQLARRVTVEVPGALIDDELNRRTEQLAGHLLRQGVDPRRADIDWDAFREQQRAAATDTVRSTLVLDAIAAREAIAVTDDDLEAEIGRQADASGRTPVATRALIEKNHGIDRLATGLRREKTIDFLMTRATIVAA